MQATGGAISIQTPKASVIIRGCQIESNALFFMEQAITSLGETPPRTSTCLFGLGGGINIETTEPTTSNVEVQQSSFLRNRIELTTPKERVRSIIAEGGAIR